VGGLNEFAYAPSTTGWIDPFGLTDVCPDPKVRKKAKDLRAGKDVTVRSFKEADQVLYTAFPDARKVRGSGPKSRARASRQKKAFKQQPDGKAVYHKDYLHDAEGTLYGHESGHAHGTVPHVNVLTPEGKKAAIFVVKD
jgi:hypothetical protein